MSWKTPCSDTPFQKIMQESTKKFIFKYFKKIALVFSFFILFFQHHFSLGGSIFLPEVLEPTTLEIILQFPNNFACNGSLLLYSICAATSCWCNKKPRTEILQEAYRATFYEALLAWFEVRKCINLNNWKLIRVLSVKKELSLMPAAIFNLKHTEEAYQSHIKGELQNTNENCAYRVKEK